MSFGGGCATVDKALGRGNSQTWMMNASQELPAATARVTVRREDDGNHNVDVAFEHLAPPSRAYDGATTYMLWVLPPGGSPENHGLINVDDDLKASLSFKTPYRDFDLLVTAEADANATKPSKNRAFTASVHSAT